MDGRPDFFREENLATRAENDEARALILARISEFEQVGIEVNFGRDIRIAVESSSIPAREIMERLGIKPKSKSATASVTHSLAIDYLPSTSRISMGHAEALQGLLGLRFVMASEPQSHEHVFPVEERSLADQFREIVNKSGFLPSVLARVHGEKLSLAAWLRSVDHARTPSLSRLERYSPALHISGIRPTKLVDTSKQEELRSAKQRRWEGRLHSAETVLKDYRRAVTAEFDEAADKECCEYCQQKFPVVIPMRYLTVGGTYQTELVCTACNRLPVEGEGEINHFGVDDEKELFDYA